MGMYGGNTQTRRCIRTFESPPNICSNKEFHGKRSICFQISLFIKSVSFEIWVCKPPFDQCLSTSGLGQYMQVYIYICLYLYTYLYTYIYIFIMFTFYIHTYVYIYICMHIYICGKVSIQECPKLTFFSKKGRAWGIRLRHPYPETFPYVYIP